MKTVISNEDTSVLDIGELKRYAGLFRYLSLRDVFVRYKQTWLGVGWALVRPLINVVIFGLLSYLIDPSEGFAGKFIQVSACIIFWQLLSGTVTEVSNSLIANSNILTKVYFPKLILPASSLLVCLIDFLIAFGIYLVIYFFAKGWPPWQFVCLPLVLALGLVFSFSLGLVFATASVKYRDVKLILPFVIQLLFYASPVFISTDYVLKHNLPRLVSLLYQLNPFVFIINAFKYCLYGTFDHFNAWYAGLALLLILLTVLFSIRYFLNFEKSFADYI